ncbi:unnamed protein product [Callosobruchus maculatus]|uniref:Fe2OG dioxygenase domain-containing protein n=1 Tax=Callosobruchus maculatus TaxID=64391 RepID=A0A653D658_CALMS|nr:unnamed protein product [Callosobruchus maculatus]
MFKQHFKYYKSKNSAPNLNDVIDVDKADLSKSLRKICLPGEDMHSSNPWGLKPSSQWQVWEIVDKPGLLIIKNPFTLDGQRMWVIKCLKDYSKKPNKRNLDALMDIDEWAKAQDNKEIAGKLCWVTLGYHHNWDSKVYSDNEKGHFPYDLKGMVEHTAKALGYNNFQAEAAIINYYHMDSTLSGHTDHSEINLEAPLFSISLGQSAIFLLGGHTLDEKPIALLLRSGDIIIMSKESRLSYHAIPKILKADSEPWNSDTEISTMLEKDVEWHLFDEYLKSSRININVRQVLKPHQKSVSDVT